MFKKNPKFTLKKNNKKQQKLPELAVLFPTLVLYTFFRYAVSTCKQRERER